MFTRASTQATALGLAALITLMMLASVNHLATSQPSAELLARTAAATAPV